MSRVFTLATLVVGGLIFADLLAHYRTTSATLGFLTGESKLLTGRAA